MPCRSSGRAGPATGPTLLDARHPSPHLPRDGPAPPTVHGRSARAPRPVSSEPPPTLPTPRPRPAVPSHRYPPTWPAPRPAAPLPGRSTLGSRSCTPCAAAPPSSAAGAQRPPRRAPAPSPRAGAAGSGALGWARSSAGRSARMPQPTPRPPPLAGPRPRPGPAPNHGPARLAPLILVQAPPKPRPEPQPAWTLRGAQAPPRDHSPWSWPRPTIAHPGPGPAPHPLSLLQAPPRARSACYRPRPGPALNSCSPCPGPSARSRPRPLPAHAPPRAPVTPLPRQLRRVLAAGFRHLCGAHRPKTPILSSTVPSTTPTLLLLAPQHRPWPRPPTTALLSSRKALALTPNLCFLERRPLEFGSSSPQHLLALSIVAPPLGPSFPCPAHRYGSAPRSPAFSLRSSHRLGSQTSSIASSVLL